MKRCPKCGADRLLRVGARSRFARLRSRVSGKTVFHCEVCGCRFWAPNLVRTTLEPSIAVPALPDPDLSALDVAVNPLGTHDRKQA